MREDELELDKFSPQTDNTGLTKFIVNVLGEGPYNVELDTNKMFLRITDIESGQEFSTHATSILTEQEILLVSACLLVSPKTSAGYRFIAKEEITQ